MDKVVVACGGIHVREDRRTQLLRLDVSRDAPADQQVQIKIDRILSGLVDDPPDILFDLLELAVYLYSADRLVRREGSTMSGMGSRWRRRFEFRIPVRRPDVWTRPHVNAGLVEVLSFLSEDTFSFSFEQRDHAASRQTHLTFDASARKFEADCVLMFSGGLDSLAGAVDEIIANRKRVVLVTHQSANAIAHRQNALAAAVDHLAPGSVLHLPIWVRKGTDQTPLEHTQRLRSFLFAALGITVARLFDQDRLLFFENGITSFNLPVAEHVIGTRASRTTHPRTLKGMERLVELLLEQPFKIDNPYLWQTKAQVVGRLKSAGCESLVPMTTSCAQVRQLSIDGHQCGVCSQCVERRFALLAADMGDTEPRHTYSVDLFDGPYVDSHQAAMAAHHVLRARELAAMSSIAFAASHGEIFRALSSLGGSSSDNIRLIHDLHRRYGEEVVSVVNQRLNAAADLNAVLETDPKSLLSILTATWPEPNSMLDDVEMAEPVSARPEVRRDERLQRPVVVIALDEKRQKIILHGGEAIGGKTFLLIQALAAGHPAEANDKPARGPFKFMRAASLLEALGAGDTAALRQQVLRARKAIAAAFFRTNGYDLDEGDVVQSRSWSGYRLNPYVVLVDIGQLSAMPARTASRFAGAPVTTRDAERGEG